MVINKRVSKILKNFVVQVTFSSLKFVETVLVVSIISLHNHWIVNNASFGILHPNWHLSLFHFDSSYIFYHQNYIYTYICLFKVFNSVIPVIILKTCRLKSFVLFRTLTLLDRSLRVLYLLTHLYTSTYLSKLSANGK